MPVIKYLFISSPGRSGSTLLDLLLGSHSKMTSLGEISHLSKNISLNTLCSCGDPVRSCSVWKQVALRVKTSHGIDIFTTPYAINLGYIKPKVVMDSIHKTYRYQIMRKIVHGTDYLTLKFDLPLLRQLFLGYHHRIIRQHSRLIYSNVSDICQTPIIVDSTKSYLKPLTLYDRFAKNTRIILLTRDGRGVMYSNLKSNFPREKSINEWKNYYFRSITLINKYIAKEHYLQVKYEDLAINPGAVLKKICNFLHLKFESSMLNFTDNPHHITNGNNMRFQKESIIKTDTAWEKGLLKSDLNYFNKIAGTLNQTLGYN